MTVVVIYMFPVEVRQVPLPNSTPPVTVETAPVTVKAQTIEPKPHTSAASTVGMKVNTSLATASETKKSAKPERKQQGIITQLLSIACLS